MKIIRYNWESFFLQKKLTNFVYSFEQVNYVNLYVNAFIKITATSIFNSTKNYNLSKTLSLLNLIFNKKCIYIKKNTIDRSEKSVKHNGIIKISIKKQNLVNEFLFFYFFYLVNVFNKKQINYSKLFINSFNYNSLVKEINSTLKLGNLINVIEVELEFNLSICSANFLYKNLLL